MSFNNTLRFEDNHTYKEIGYSEIENISCTTHPCRGLLFVFMSTDCTGSELVKLVLKMLREVRRMVDYYKIIHNDNARCGGLNQMCFNRKVHKCYGFYNKIK